MGCPLCAASFSHDLTATFIPPFPASAVVNPKKLHGHFVFWKVLLRFSIYIKNRTYLRFSTLISFLDSKNEGLKLDVKMAEEKKVLSHKRNLKPHRTNTLSSIVRGAHRDERSHRFGPSLYLLLFFPRQTRMGKVLCFPRKQNWSVLHRICYYILCSMLLQFVFSLKHNAQLVQMVKVGRRVQESLDQWELMKVCICTCIFFSPLQSFKLR
jgi:hypothetical protein